jgi:hypothetical protein
VTAAWAYVALWGALIAVLAVIQPVFELDGLQFGLAVAAGAVMLVLGGLLLARPRHERVRLLPENSWATVMVAVGVVMVATGLIFGQWLYLLGAGVLVLGAGGVVREYLAARRSSGRSAG